MCEKYPPCECGRQSGIEIRRRAPTMLGKDAADYSAPLHEAGIVGKFCVAGAKAVAAATPLARIGVAVALSVATVPHCVCVTT